MALPRTRFRNGARSMVAPMSRPSSACANSSSRTRASSGSSPSGILRSTSSRRSLQKMMRAQQRRETVQQMRARGLSLRRRCALCHIGHSSLRYRPRTMRRLQNQELGRLRAIARSHPRYGYRRAHALVERDGTVVNVKRVHRLWRLEGLSVPCRRPRRRRAESKGTRLVEATRPNQVWTYDFVHDRCANG